MSKDDFILKNIDEIDSADFSEYIKELLSFRSRDIEVFLSWNALNFYRKKPRIERSFKGVDVFTIRAYILGKDIHLESFSGVEVPIRIVANPSIAIKDEHVDIYLRLSSLGSHPIPNPWSRTFIGLARTSLQLLRNRIELRVEPLLYPYVSIERVEDPRIVPETNELYHVRAYEFYRPISNTTSYTITFRSIVNEHGIPKNLEPVRFRWIDGSEHIIRDYRDTFPLNKDYMVIRPWIEGLGIGMIMIAPRSSAVVDIRDIRSYPEFVPNENERKTGGNCSTKLSSNEYIVIFHSVDKYFGCYYTYIAILDSNGELLGITPKPVITPRVRDYFGARPATVFVCGAQIVKDKLIVSAGKDDEITLILEADIDRVIEMMKFIRG